MYTGTLVGLRAREPSDAEALSAWFSDPETMRWWDRVYPPLPPEALSARIAAAPPPGFGEVSFAVVALDTERVIGWCGLHSPSAEHRHAGMGVLIGDASYRGRGYGTDATRTLCRFAFDRMNLVRVSLVVFPENVAARRAYERAGFVEEGVQRRAFFRGGGYLDLIHMAVFPDTLR